MIRLAGSNNSSWPSAHAQVAANCYTYCSNKFHAVNNCCVWSHWIFLRFGASRMQLAFFLCTGILLSSKFLERLIVNINVWCLGNINICLKSRFILKSFVFLQKVWRLVDVQFLVLIVFFYWKLSHMYMPQQPIYRNVFVVIDFSFRNSNPVIKANA